MNLISRYASRLLGLFYLNIWASFWGIVIVAASVLFFTVHIIKEETEYAHGQVDAMVHLVGRGVVPSVQRFLETKDNDRELEQTISNILEDDGLSLVQVLDDQGVPVLQVGSERLGEEGAADVAAISVPPTERKYRSVKYEDRLVHWHPVTKDGAGAFLGWLRLDYNLETVNAFQAQFFWDNIIDGLFISAIGGGILLLIMWPPIRSFNRGIRAASSLAGRQGDTFDLGVGTRELRTLERVLNKTSRRLHQMTQERIDTVDLLTTVLDNAADAVITINAKGIIQTFNAQSEEMFGYSEGEVIGKNIKMLMPEPYRSKHDQYLAAFNPGRESPVLERRVELEALRKDGTVFPIELGVGALDYQGEVHFVGTIRDITERKSYEEALNKSHRRVVEAQKLARIGRWEWDIESDKIERDKDMYGALGLEVEKLSQTMDDLIETIHPDDREMFRLSLMRALSGEDEAFDCEYRIILQDDTVHALHSHGFVRRDEGGKPIGMVGTAQDVSDRRSTEDALRRSEKSMATAQRIAGFGSWQWNINTGEVIWSDMAYQIYGVNPGERDPSYDLMFETVHPDDRALFEETVLRSVEDGVPYVFEHRIKSRGGVVRTVREVGEIAHDDAGRPTLMTGTVLDITEYRAAEEQKQQSQKMAAVGQLASGVAHEFNNLLVAIGGFARMAQAHPEDVDRVVMCLEEVTAASDRAGELTSQLLSFSRRRDTTAKMVKIDEVVEGLKRLLGPVLGAQVNLRMELGAGKMQVEVDPGQTAQAIMNLAINARDAMPRGGDLIIRTWVGPVPQEAGQGERKVKIKGNAVCISVTDTGDGIAPENMDRLFEPFFTTKEEGKGTGLGLAMVYTTASDAGGFIDVSSAPGKGATFSIYLPAAGEEIEGFDPAAPLAKDAGDMEGGARGILVIEDDPIVSQLAVMSLEEDGFYVFTAETGAAGRKLAMDGFFQIDIAIVDIDLPDANGVDLARELTETHPNLKILLMSGLDMEEPTGEHGRSTPFLKKPFRPEKLQAMVHDVLGSGDEEI